MSDYWTDDIQFTPGLIGSGVDRIAANSSISIVTTVDVPEGSSIIVIVMAGQSIGSLGAGNAPTASDGVNSYGKAGAGKPDFTAGFTGNDECGVFAFSTHKIPALLASGTTISVTWPAGPTIGDKVMYVYGVLRTDPPSYATSPSVYSNQFPGGFFGSNTITRTDWAPYYGQGARGELFGEDVGQVVDEVPASPTLLFTVLAINQNGTITDTNLHDFHFLSADHLTIPVIVANDGQVNFRLYYAIVPSDYQVLYPQEFTLTGGGLVNPFIANAWYYIHTTEDAVDIDYHPLTARKVRVYNDNYSIKADLYDDPVLTTASTTLVVAALGSSPSHLIRFRFPSCSYNNHNGILAVLVHRSDMTGGLYRNEIHFSDDSGLTWPTDSTHLIAVPAPPTVGFPALGSICWADALGVVAVPVVMQYSRGDKQWYMTYGSWSLSGGAAVLTFTTPVATTLFGAPIVGRISQRPDGVLEFLFRDLAGVFQLARCEDMKVGTWV